MTVLLGLSNFSQNYEVYKSEWSLTDAMSVVKKLMRELFVNYYFDWSMLGKQMPRCSCIMHWYPIYSNATYRIAMR